ncbi:hypothetical protein EVJ58_g3757 [Rhodofomes roseus]|uniref:Uncharacterized protein n=1 Tax=Rhodofomes roseus TaxID=34475 RepID=A0A4Y9YKX2_9APHY|nr:hypothetical protein EVJ58_g3757 [Rhodofomes roseus]
MWRRNESQPAPRHIPAPNEIYAGGYLFNGPIDDIEDLEILEEIMADQFGGGRLRGPLAAAERPREQHYKASYTHPDQPMPGFTFDFAPPEPPSTSGTSSPIIILDDDDETTAGPSKASGKSSAVEAVATLVCAHCNDPLALSAESAAPADQLARVKLWGLRCGHMLDGKCIQELMKPSAPPPPTLPLPETEDMVHDRKGKGKARAVLHADIAMDIVETDPPTSGKGKTRATAKESVTPRRGKRKAVEISADVSRADNAVPLEDNSIRSRLRPRHPRVPSNIGVPPAHESVAASSVVSPPSPVRPVRAMPRRRGNGPSSATRVRGKGKGKAKPVVEDIFDWVCPVAGCARAHVSVLVDGEWKMDPEKGAISLFI